MSGFRAYTPPAAYSRRSLVQIGNAEIASHVDARGGSTRLADRTLALYRRAAKSRGCTPVEVMASMLGGWRV